MRASTLYEALALLQQLKAISPGEFPKGIEWIRVAGACGSLEFELRQAGLTVPVEAERAAA